MSTGNRKVLVINLNNDQYGWHFIELTKGLSQGIKDSILVFFEKGDRIIETNVNGVEDFDWAVFDTDGNYISEKIKLPGLLYHHSSRNFFQFYNPTSAELADSNNWMPMNSKYLNIKEVGKRQLDSLLSMK